MMKPSEQIEQIVEYIRGRLDVEAAEALERRIAAEPELRRLYELVQAIADESTDLGWPETAEIARAVSSRMIEDFFKKRPKGSGAPGVRVYDSKLFPLPEGVRPATVDTRHLKFKIDEMDLAVSLYPVSPDSYQVIGRLTGWKSENLVAVTLQSDNAVLKGEADRFNLFHFPRVPKGEYRLELQAGERKIGALDIDV